MWHSPEPALPLRRSAEAGHLASTTFRPTLATSPGPAQLHSWLPLRSRFEWWQEPYRQRTRAPRPFPNRRRARHLAIYRGECNWMGGTPHFLSLRYIAAYGELWARGRSSTRGRDVPDSVARCFYAASGLQPLPIAVESGGLDLCTDRESPLRPERLCSASIALPSDVALVSTRGVCPASEFQDVRCNLGRKIDLIQEDIILR